MFWLKKSKNAIKMGSNSTSKDFFVIKRVTSHFYCIFQQFLNPSKILTSSSVICKIYQYWNIFQKIQIYKRNINCEYTSSFQITVQLSSFHFQQQHQMTQNIITEDSGVTFCRIYEYAFLCCTCYFFSNISKSATFLRYMAGNIYQLVSLI